MRQKQAFINKNQVGILGVKNVSLNKLPIPWIAKRYSQIIGQNMEKWARKFSQNVLGENKERGKKSQHTWSQQ